jgi:hypothetical protein
VPEETRTVRGWSAVFGGRFRGSAVVSGTAVICAYCQNDERKR